MSSILVLPAELLETIGERLTVADIFSLRLTCKQLGDVFAAAIFRVITIDLSGKRVDNCLDKLRALANGHPLAIQGARELHLTFLSPSFSPDQMTNTPSKYTPQQIAQELENHLFTAVSSLRGVQTFSWLPAFDELESVQAIVVQALLTLPNIRNLEIGLIPFKVDFPFDSIPSLHSLSLENISIDSGRTGSDVDKTFQRFASVVARSPHLSRIRLGGYSSSEGGKSPFTSVHYLLESYPKHLPPLRIRHLAVEDIFFRLDDLTIPHMRYLTSLKMKYRTHPFGSAGRQSFDSTTHLANNGVDPQLTRVGSTRAEVWRTLRIEGIHLEEIETDSVSEPFLEYLESYSGIRELNLLPHNYSTAEESDVAAKRFYTVSIRRHARSLRHLSVVALYEGRWCFSHKIVDFISECNRLKSLDMRVNSDQVKKSSLSFQKDIVAVFIDTAATFLPHLENLHIGDAVPESLRDVVCSYGYDLFANARKIHQRVLGYQAPVGCEQLPLLRVSYTYSYIPMWSPSAGAESQSSSIIKRLRATALKGPQRRLVYKVVEAPANTSGTSSVSGSEFDFDES